MEETRKKSKVEREGEGQSHRGSQINSHSSQGTQRRGLKTNKKIRYGEISYKKTKIRAKLNTQGSQDGDDQHHSKYTRLEIDLDSLPTDPGLRKKISDYHLNDRDEIQRVYLQRGPCQPRGHKFPQKKFGNVFCRFNPTWFNEFGNWLEYSIEKDVVFCLCCYLMRVSVEEQQIGGDSFIYEGFTNWKKKERLYVHVGGPNSSHNQAWSKCQDLMNQRQHVESVLSRQSEQAKKEYRIRLTATVDCVRFLLRQGLAFRGHDESEDSRNQGNFLELLQFLADHNDNICNVVLKNAPKNLKVTVHDIQKDIVNAAASLTTSAIIDELGDDFFSILIDESRDVSIKEQMVVLLRYVNKEGSVMERFLGIVHVSDTTSLSLKEAIKSLFSKHELSLSRVRGQGYDGASNMKGEFNGLKSLILKENKFAFYVHCFAHQLQLALVAVAKSHNQIALLFNILSNLVNVVGGSCKRRDILREKQASKVIEALSSGEITNGRGLNQESSLQRPGDTRWGSHYGTLMNLIILFSSVIDVLEIVAEDGTSYEQKGEACVLLDLIQSFEFVFNMHLMKNVLGILNELSQALQRKDQDIVNAMILVKLSKQRLQQMRDDGWKQLLSEVLSFCEKHLIVIPNMDDIYVVRGRARRNAQHHTNMHHYKVELFYWVIDKQLQELNDRFTEVKTELLLCMGCLNPRNSFSAFDKDKLIRLAQFYSLEFSEVELMALDNQLETYIIDVRSDDEFLEVNGISGLAKKLVQTKKNIVYPLVYLLVKLALILPVATATVERAFSAMNIIKNRLQNRMGDQWMNDCLITYIEKDMFATIDNEKVIQRFQNMKTRREQL